MNETTIHPALDEFDAAMRTPRARLAAITKENAGLTAEANALRQVTTRLTGENEAFRAEVRSLNDARRVLTAELDEARKQPVALLPEFTEALMEDAYAEWEKPEHPASESGLASAINTVLASHFREAAEARTKPTVDVEAVVEAALQNLQETSRIREAFESALRARVTDAPAAKPALDVEAVIEAISARLHTSPIVGIDAVMREVLPQFVTDAPAPAADETLAAAVARVQAETRRECAAICRKHSHFTYISGDRMREIADAMERGE